VASVVVGMRAPDEVTTNVEVFAPDVPADFWAELKQEGLLRQDAPTP
jgi:D-threo-aldose 1-dehydrogenase